MAALDRAEADKLRIVKEAEAEAERKRLQGEGIASMRKAMLSGYEEGITGLAQSLASRRRTPWSPPWSPSTLTPLEKLASSPNAKTVLYSSDAAGAVTNLGGQFGALFADTASGAVAPKPPQELETADRQTAPRRLFAARVWILFCFS
ncbi:lipid raft-associated protein [Pandoravirus inopinatum]|uniref:Lipid raft-associated protein n=1 Tax=Pandoravirus inopinatum TaxID=1605721 RepID=A0A0B5J905_9VIRU|nr:lipid raft-associated protein [Pandoravirus inopinatum]AJF98450.1 lipid raft-associated protein [Pandoravirus inopinatum]